MALLEIKDLNVRYLMKERQILACDCVSLTVEEQDSIGIVGESGSGKSTLAMGILGLLPKSITQMEGDILFKGLNLVGLSDREYAKIRWKELSAVFQKSMSSLSPVHKISRQMADIYRVHVPGATDAECREKALEILEKVNLPQRVCDLYPHQLSGGMIQRVSIALCLMFHPSLIILDEATTALDVVTESQILREIERLQETEKVTRLMITHNMAVVASSCKKVAVMYAGRMMETGKTEDVLKYPQHPYTQGLLKSFPSFTGDRQSLRGIPGSLPDLSVPMPGCAFAPRCPKACEKCFSQRPELSEIQPGWKVACFYPEKGGEAHAQ
ncbi:MAG: ABC transporter ATP-binding protein [Christensenellales bacterium]|jgi:peptide/nickel transport system ATP-binding protein